MKTQTGLIVLLLAWATITNAKDVFHCMSSKDPSKSKELIVWTNECKYKGKHTTLAPVFSAYLKSEEWLGSKDNLGYRLFPKTLPDTNSQSAYKISGESYVLRSKWSGKNRVSVGIYNTDTHELVSVLHMRKKGLKINLLQESTED